MRGLAAARTVQAVHGLSTFEPDPDHELGLSARLQRDYDRTALQALYQRFTQGTGPFDHLMRRVILRAMVARQGQAILVGCHLQIKHPETFELGDKVHIGDHVNLQGRHDGHCCIGNHVWIGAQCFFDARQLIIEDYVGWGPGAKVLGSQHTGLPVDVPIIQTDLIIKPVRIEAEADIGTNAVILPGVTVGRGSMVGAGAIVTRDVPPYAVVAGVPAKFMKWRDDGPHEEVQQCGI